MKKRSEGTGSTLLAASIFVLWSFGVIIVPTVTLGPLVPILIAVYLALHVVVFCIAAALLARDVKKFRRGRGVPTLTYTVLYIYVLVALTWSVYLIVHARYF